MRFVCSLQAFLLLLLASSICHLVKLLESASPTAAHLNWCAAFLLLGGYLYCVRHCHISHISPIGLMVSVTTH